LDDEPQKPNTDKPIKPTYEEPTFTKEDLLAEDPKDDQKEEEMQQVKKGDDKDV
jgi:hypothetical protein